VNEPDVLSRRALNRALLARQMLLSRQEVPVDQALERLVGMQAQDPQAPYVGLWTRLEGFDPNDLSGLIAGRGAVRGTLMRCTVHLVTRNDWARLWLLTAPARERGFRASPFARELANVDLDDLLEAVRDQLNDRPLSRPELAAILSERWPGVDPPSLAQASTLIPVVQAPPRGLWGQGGQARWITSEAWFGARIEEPAALDTVIRRYLAAYGPASLKDIQAWSGLTGLRDHLTEMRPTLRTFRDEKGQELFDVPDGRLPVADTRAPVRFLAPFDNVQLAHAERSRIIDPAHRDHIYRDRLMRAFLVDGFIAGSWQVKAGTLTLKPVRRLSKAELAELKDEGMRLLAFAAPDAPRPSIQVEST
jgi:hypothetical protein